MIICQTVFFIFTEIIVLVTASYLLTPFRSLVFFKEDLTANLQKTETSMKSQVCALTRQTVKHHVSCCFFLELWVFCRSFD